MLGFDLSPLTGQTPTVALARLRRGGPVSRLGQENVRSIETTHYREELNYTEAGAVYHSVEAWVDSQGLVRRLTLDFAPRLRPTSNVRSHTVLTMTFSDFGTHVSVSPPKASDVLGSSEVQG
jgi:hypothetical protein